MTLVRERFDDVGVSGRTHGAVNLIRDDLCVAGRNHAEVSWVREPLEDLRGEVNLIREIPGDLWIAG